MFDFIKKLFGTRSEREIKSLYPYVDQINAEVEKLKSLKHEQLREKTQQLKQQIHSELKNISHDISLLKEEANLSTDVARKDALFKEIDTLKKAYNKQLEVVLINILPQAFAIVKETARRFKENEELFVKAEDYDRELAKNVAYVSLQGEHAIWKNKWEAAGNEITWDMLHYDVQLIGGVILHQGKIAEMATGEGKTLVATLPAFLNALAGKGVHIVTVNEYLARRDAEWMGPLFEFHGLRVDCIDRYPAHSEKRREAYRADITYGTNNEFGFDYLRDNMATEVDEIVQQEHHFAMIDEVDSVLIDDARTPLIISGPAAKDDEEEYYALKPRIKALYDAQRQKVTQYLQEAKKLIAEENKDDGGLALFRVYRGLPKYRPLIKYLSEPGVKQILQDKENYYLQDNSRFMPEADEPLLFVIDEQHSNIELTDNGLAYLAQEGEDKSFFLLPDIGAGVAEIENDTTLNEEEKLAQKDAMVQEYTLKAQRIHIVNQLLRAYALFEKDVEYIVVNNKVKIVDEQTGRVLDGRRYSDGLHQAIEAKENVKVQKASQTYATVTLQNYFRMYHKLSGMTGTAETEAAEFWEIYKLDVLSTPTNKPIVRDDKDDKVYRSVREKFNAVVEEIVILTEQGRPVLVGTTSVEISELVSRLLSIRKIKHQVLNAKQHQREAEIVAQAGHAGTVTIATNMAGRGTDIKLTEEARKAGGLAIIGTERHESRRVDRQLRGRSGRQGDVGSSQFFVSLEDNLMRLFGSDRIARIMDKMGLEEGEVIQHSMITKSIERAQKKVEENNFSHRKRLLEYDDVMNIQREVIYKRRQHALFGERVELDIMNMMYSSAEKIVKETCEGNNYEALKFHLFTKLGIVTKVTAHAFAQSKASDLTKVVYREFYQTYQKRKQDIKDKALSVMSGLYETKGKSLRNIEVPFFDGNKHFGVVVGLQACIDSEGEALIRALERSVILDWIDRYWKEHLQEMDNLRQSVQNAVYEQKDPLLVYKFESFELFKKFIHKINVKIISFLLKDVTLVADPKELHEAEGRTSNHPSHLLEEMKQAFETLHTVSEQEEDQEVVNTPIRLSKMPGRNDRVTVQYNDGTIKKEVKFKTVEEDIMDGIAVLLMENDEENI